MHIPSYLIFCIFAGILAVIRVIYTGSTDLFGLVWNLILAFLPYIFALGYVTYHQHFRWIFLAFWLFVLPNSFYILTDFVHLSRFPETVYFDIVYITAMAFAGMVSGYASMEIVHREWNKYFHKQLVWFFMTSVVVVSIIGVYIGRFLRFNSWDIIHHPLQVFRESLVILMTNGGTWHISDPERARVSAMFEVGVIGLWQFVLLYAVFFMLVYVYIYYARRR